MSTISQVSKAMKRVLTGVADDCAAATGLVRRRSKLTGAKFVQTLVFGWLEDPDASLSGLTRTAAALNVRISPQALFQRFTQQAAECLRRVLEAATREVIAADPVAVPVLRRFSAVLAQDSTAIALPNALEEVWSGCGGTGSYGKSALKLQVRMDMNTGRLWGPFLDRGRSPDGNSWVGRDPVPKGALLLADLGYFRLAAFRELDESGAYFLSRLKTGVNLYLEDGSKLDVSELLASSNRRPAESPVLLGSGCRLPVRLLAAPVSPEVAAQRRCRLKERARKTGRAASREGLRRCGWTLLITNAPANLMSLDDALTLMRVRWQIELLFKLWKQHGGVERWRSENRWRILCEVCAKLIAMVILHWTMLMGCWADPRRSLVKAAGVVRSYAAMLACSMSGLFVSTAKALEQIGLCLRAGNRIQNRRRNPSAPQLLLALDELGGAL